MLAMRRDLRKVGVGGTAMPGHFQRKDGI